jgi:hypothetical protein
VPARTAPTRTEPSTAGPTRTARRGPAGRRPPGRPAATRETPGPGRPRARCQETAGTRLRDSQAKGSRAKDSTAKDNQDRNNQAAVPGPPAPGRPAVRPQGVRRARAKAGRRRRRTVLAGTRPPPDTAPGRGTPVHGRPRAPDRVKPGRPALVAAAPAGTPARGRPPDRSKAQASARDKSSSVRDSSARASGTPVPRKRRAGRQARDGRAQARASSLIPVSRTPAASSTRVAPGACGTLAGSGGSAAR